MKRSTLSKLMSIVLCFTVLFCGGITANAEDAEVSDEGAAVSRISCTVYDDASTMRGFCWYTAEETDTVVVIYEDGVDVTDTLTVTVSCSSWKSNYVHKAVVSGLTAGTEYTYKVGNGSVWSDLGTFTTDDGDDAFNFVVIADVQASSLANFESAANVMTTAYEMMPDAEFYVNLGDFTNDCTNEEWDYYAEAFDSINLGTTLVPVTGNHDSTSKWFSNLFCLDESESVQTSNGVNYSFDYGNVHIAVVNTNDMISISDLQLEWLENDMNSTSADWKIVFMHKSPYTLGKDGKWPDAQYLQESLAEVCDATGVDIVMSGHDHMYLRTKSLTDNTVVDDDEGVTYVLSGTAGTKRYQIRDFALENFLPTEFIDACVVQKNGYANYYDGVDFSSTDQANVGGCFNTVSIDGGTLTLNSYIVSDEDGTTKLIDTKVIEKEQGQNTATYSGDNTTSTIEYIIDAVPSFLHFAVYTLTKWLPTFIKALPDIIYTYVTTGTF